MSEEPLLRVAIPAPLYTFFDYLPPDGIDCSALQPGIRLMLPFGRGKRVGILIEVGVEGNPAFANKLRRIEEILDQAPLLSAESISLLRWAADYYRFPPGEVICSALPVRLREGKSAIDYRQTGLQLTALGRESSAEKLRRAPRQAQLFQLLVDGTVHSNEELGEQMPDFRTSVKALTEKGLLERVEMAELPCMATQPVGPVLNAEQRVAVDEIIGSLGRYNTLLLDGVTGSGKTEVYLKATSQALLNGGQVLVLVPEIGLTPQLLSRFRRRLAAPVAVIHSGLSATERESAWHRVRLSRAKVLIGTRSAILTPIPDLALIIVDEEHDLSYKQQDGFRYSARDMAVVRASRRNCPVVLGSATPSLESLYNAQRKRYQLLRLTQRAGNAQPPRIDLIDVRNKRLVAGLSSSLQQLVRETLEDGAQVLLFLNRRGYAPLMVCKTCGWFSQCKYCDSRMTLHLGQGILWCHHCGSQRRPSSTCPDCGQPTVEPAGQGTERLEHELSRLFDGASVVRIDRDSTSRKGSFERLLGEIHSGQHSILIGTQMLAKGHHFPNVTLVGILDVDQGFYGVDYHAMERMAQTIVQVSGRAGRAERKGRVAIQTRHPDHPLLHSLIRQGYNVFAMEALAERQAAGLPPYRFQALFRAEGTKAQPPRLFLEEVRNKLKACGLRGLEVLGPIPAPMEKRAGRFRAHLLVQAESRAVLQQALEQQIATLPSIKAGGKVRWSVDVDPMEMA